MGQRFVVIDLRRGGSDANRDDIRMYFWEVRRRLHNAEHAETRVYTCRSWRSTGGATAPYELHWNDESVPGEMLLGSSGWCPETELVERIEAEFSKGESVRLFTFNSDADLIIEEVLVPLPAGVARVAFPELQPESTLELPAAVIIGGGLVAAVLLLPNAWKSRSIVAGVLGIVAALPFFWWILGSSWLGVLNAILRYRWARQFPRRLNCGQLRTALAADPGRFVMHVRLYGDVTRLCPAAVLEDRTSGDFAAVYPPSSLVVELCEQLHVEILRQ